MKACLVFSVVILLGIAGLFIGNPRVKAQGVKVYIRADGSIDPPTANITTSDSLTYTFTGNNTVAIEIQRSNITLDGAGYTLQNPGGESTGILEQTNTMISADNITVRDMIIRGFIVEGISLSNSTGNQILNNTIIGNDCGVYIFLDRSAARIIVSGNKLNNTSHGIYVYRGSGNYIYGNDITGCNMQAITLAYSNDNYVCENNLFDNNKKDGYFEDIAVVGNSRNNFIFSNNIIGEGYAEQPASPNVWDVGGYGNYWSSYTGEDLNDDGVGDTPYDIYPPGNVDNHPLMNYNGTTTRTYWPKSLEVKVTSNSTVKGFSFNETLKQITFNVTGINGAHGFCNITFPAELLSGVITAYRDGILLSEGLDYTKTFNISNSRYTLSFAYTHSTHTLVIIGTEAIPEYGTFFLLTLPLVAFFVLFTFLSHGKPQNHKTLLHGFGYTFRLRHNIR